MVRKVKNRHTNSKKLDERDRVQLALFNGNRHPFWPRSLGITTEVFNRTKEVIKDAEKEQEKTERNVNQLELFKVDYTGEAKKHGVVGILMFGASFAISAISGAVALAISMYLFVGAVMHGAAAILKNGKGKNKEKK
ncbi:MAG: phage holin family protein [Candidatus Micrarchaeota archaeon]